MENRMTKTRNKEKTMKKLKGLLILSLTFACLLLTSTAAKADSALTITFASPYQAGDGSVFDFYATLTNTGADTLYVNGGGVTVLDTGLSLDDSPFNTDSNFWELAPGASYTGLFFTVTAPSYVQGASNYYKGTYEIWGGANIESQDLLASPNFDIQVTPEPSSMVLLATGLVGLAGTLRRRLTR
jgi:hypothetical protein